MRAAGVLCAVVVLLVCSAGTAGAAWDGTVNGTWYQDETAAGHDGTLAKPFLIHDEKSLAALANETNTNESQSGFHDKYILLMNDLYLNGTSHVWTPIGNTTALSYIGNELKGVFQGTFNGTNHTITGMNVTNLSASTWIYGGLFGVVNLSTITSVNLTNVVVNVQTTDGAAYSGGLVGEAFGGETTITNCCVNGVVTANANNNTYSGGLVGYTYGSIANCYASGAVAASSNSASASPSSGGLAGYASSGSSITNCYATATVTASGSGTSFSGGLVGSAHGSITNCYATGAVTASCTGGSNTYSGGLVGFVSNSITNSSALNNWVNASGTGTINIGRFVGGIQSNPTIISPYAWRHMGLNISGAIIQPVAEDATGKNATNASTVMIWANETFYTNLGWTFSSGGNWTMGSSETYRLPVLAWQGSAPAVDVSYLNLTHNVGLSVTGDGTVTSDKTLPKIRDGVSIIFTITGEIGSFVDNGIDKTSEIFGSKYIIPDLSKDHVINAVFPVPPVPPVPSGSSDGNMDGAYRVLFDTVGGSTISPATGLSSGDRVAKPADPVRDGFTFGGWYTDEDGTGAWDFTGGIPGDMTLYAAWTTTADERTIPVTAAATRETAPHTTAPQQTDAAPVITTATTEFTVSPVLTEAPAPFAGLLAGLLAAGILLRRRE